MPDCFTLDRKGKGVPQSHRHRGVDSQADISSRQHRPHKPSNVHLPESSSAGTQLVASRGQEYTPFDPALGFSSATPAEIATINDACEGRKVKSATFICRLLEEIQKAPEVKEDDWVNVAALGMRYLPAMINPEEPFPQCADSNGWLHGKPHVHRTMGSQGLDEVKISSDDPNFKQIIIWHHLNSEGLNMKVIFPKILSRGGGASLPADHSRSWLSSQGEPSDDPKPGLSYAWTITDSEGGTPAGPRMSDEYEESDEDEKVYRPGMKGTLRGPTGMTVTTGASEEELPSNVVSTQPAASVASGLPIVGISQAPVSAGPDLSVEEATVGVNPQPPAGAMPNGNWEGFFSLGTLWKTLESLSS